MDKKSKTIIFSSIIALSIVTILLTYAYYSARITGVDSASTISMSGGTMTIIYSEGTSDILVQSAIYPRAQEWATKTFTLTANNSTTQVMDYQVGLEIVTNTFKGGQLSYSLEVGNNNDGISMPAVTNKAITKTSGTMLIGKGSFPGNTTNGVQTYTLKIYFLDNGKDQNINQGAVFNARMVVGDKGSIVAVNDCIDTAHPTPVSGNVYENGQYYYTYGNAYNGVPAGWNVNLTDLNSTDPVTAPTCTSINGIPVVSMIWTFAESKASSIDLSGLDTSNIVSMSGTFYGISANTSLDLSTLDTSNVINMDQMFSYNSISSLDLRSFDTSNVTSMVEMFFSNSSTSIDLSSFNTANVTDMQEMFGGSTASTLDLSSFDVSNVANISDIFDMSLATSIVLFDTSNVTDMSYLFANTAVTTISNIDTSNVTNMERMFWGSVATSIDLSSFDTSNVENMSYMFSDTAATALDLSSFDTSSVTDMSYMFSGSAATTLDLSSFNTSSVTDMESMFEDSSATTLDLSSFDLTNISAAGMRYMFRNCAATIGYARTASDVSKLNSSFTSRPVDLTFIVKP